MEAGIEVSVPCGDVPHALVELQQRTNNGADQPETAAGDDQQAQQQAPQDQVPGVADDGIELANLILDGGVPFGLDLDQCQPELVGTALITGQLCLVRGQGGDPLADQACIVGLQGAVLSG